MLKEFGVSFLETVKQSGLPKCPAWAVHSLRKLSAIVLAAITVFGLWQIACEVFSIPVYLLPAPSEIWSESVRVAHPIMVHTLATLITTLLGFGLSVVIGLPLAALIASSGSVSAVLWPALVVTQSVPKVALAPILVLICGTNELPRVIVTFLVGFFPLVLASATGLKNVPEDLLELGRAYQADRWTEFKCIRLPYAVPFIFSGLKAAITLSVVGAVVGEFVNSDQGLGYLIVTSTAFFKTPLAWAAMVLLSAMGIVLFRLIVLIERIGFPWSFPNEPAD
jgi:NitT/TauT family transport system permease protein